MICNSANIAMAVEVIARCIRLKDVDNAWTSSNGA